MPVKVLSIAQFMQEEKETAKERIWRRLTLKHQKTQVRIVYLRKEFALKQAIPLNFAYHIVQTQESISAKLNEEDKFL
jgi:Flp pilus assembly protein CpaB